MGIEGKTGKLSAGALARLLKRFAPARDPSVLVGPRVGVDAAAVKVEKGVLVAASDPITYATEGIGRLAVHVNANDLFVSAAEPRWFLAAILLPPGRQRLAEGIFRDIHAACAELGISLIGGHTELTPGLPRPMVVGCMIGQTIGRKALTADGSRPGDVIVLTKGAAIEGTAVIAREHARELRRHLPAPLLRRARRFLQVPGISIHREAKIASRCGVHAMHDPTEGGVLGGLWEMSESSGLAFHVDPDRIPVYPETRAVCQRFGLDPLGLLASGALLVACPQRAAGRLLGALHSEGIAACEIGRVRKGRPGMHLGRRQVVARAMPDEILKIGPRPGIMPAKGRGA